MSRSLYWIWVSLRIGVGKTDFPSLLEHFGSPEAIYEADANELRDYFGDKKKPLLESLLNKKLDEAYEIESYCAKNHITILKYSQKGYPKLLTNLKNPPIILYARGDIADLDSRVSISVVGTRSLSEYGRQSAYKIGYELAAAGAVVVSGLALGIDSVAACGALDARGRTVAVLGSGLDRIYPAAHKKLAAEVAKKGLILSEYPPLTAPTRYSFPMRNRIISGLSQGTLIVEAGEGSGALITAKEAIVQGRDVYALPGNVGFANAVGTNDLIKSGATAVTCAADILENYRYLYGKELNLSVLARVSSRSSLKRGALKAHGVDEGVPHVRPRESQPPRGELSEMLHSAGKLDGETVKRISGETEYPMYGESPRIRSAETETKVAEAEIPSHLDPKAAAILRAMPAGQAVSFETLCGEGSEADDVMMMLTLLEIEGLVVTLPGNRYMRK